MAYSPALEIPHQTPGMRDDSRANGIGALRGRQGEAPGRCLQIFHINKFSNSFILNGCSALLNIAHSCHMHSDTSSTTKGEGSERGAWLRKRGRGGQALLGIGVAWLAWLHGLLGSACSTVPIPHRSHHQAILLTGGFCKSTRSLKW